MLVNEVNYFAKLLAEGFKSTRTRKRVIFCGIFYIN